MSRRRQDLADKLMSEGKPKGWQDVVAFGHEAEPEEEPPAKPEQELIHKTYILRRKAVQRLADIAKREKVPVNELARFLFQYALDEVDSGQLKIPTASETRRIES